MRIMTKRILILACLFTLASAPAQQPKPKYPIRSIGIEGNELYSDEQIIGLSGLKIGQPANQDTFEAARDKILTSGAFETIAFRFGPAGGGYEVVYEVAEIEQVYPLRFENMGIPDEEIRAWLKAKDPLFGEEVPGTQQLIERYVIAIEELLESRGERKEMRGEVTADMPGEYYIMFHPKGAMPVIAEVDFQGNKILSTDTLRETIHGVAIGSRYTDGRFRLILNSNVRPAYEFRGYAGVTFPEIETGPAGGGVNGIRVVVTVDEGKIYNFGRVELRGTASMDRRLLAATGIQPGEVADLNLVSSAPRNIKEELAAEGYMAGKVEVEKTVDRDKRTVDVLIQVDPGPEFQFGELFVAGLDLHGEHEIKRIWGLQKGAKFLASYPDYFLQQIREQGVFDHLQKAKAELQINERDRTVDVTLVFNPKERRMRFGIPDEEEPQYKGRRRR